MPSKFLKSRTVVFWSEKEKIVWGAPEFTLVYSDKADAEAAKKTLETLHKPGVKDAL